MVDDVAAVWGGQIKLGRKPANNEILIGNTDGNFALAASWSEGVKSSDQSVTNSTTLANATGLSFSVVSGTYYSFNFGLILESVTSRGVKIAITTPSSGLGWAPANSNSVPGTGTSGTEINVIPTASASGTYSVNILGYFNCGTNGTLQLQFAQISAASATSATIYKGSWLRYRTV